jgi:Tol biopolymer transport system component
MNADGSNRTPLTNAGFYEDPVWSPDGTKITFYSYRYDNFDVYVMNANGSNQVRLTNHPAFDAGADWSPDGTRLVFQSERDGNTEIYVMNADGSNQARLTTNTVFDAGPAWSPDGTKMVFQRIQEGNADIYVMDADGSHQIRLTNSGNNFGPAWQPLRQGPTSKDDCKADGWRRFTNPSFKNQGQCVSFVEHQTRR